MCDQGKPGVDVGPARQDAGAVIVAVSRQARVAVPAVGLHEAAGRDRGVAAAAPERGALGVGDHAQVGPAQTAVWPSARPPWRPALVWLAAAAAGQSPAACRR